MDLIKLAELGVYGRVGVKALVGGHGTADLEHIDGEFYFGATAFAEAGVYARVVIIKNKYELNWEKPLVELGVRTMPYQFSINEAKSDDPRVEISGEGIVTVNAAPNEEFEFWVKVYYWGSTRKSYELYKIVPVRYTPEATEIWKICEVAEPVATFLVTDLATGELVGSYTTHVLPGAEKIYGMTLFPSVPGHTYQAEEIACPPGTHPLLAAQQADSGGIVTFRNVKDEKKTAKVKLSEILDPSGFVYTGTEPNRLSGVTVTLYFGGTGAKPGNNQYGSVTVTPGSARSGDTVTVSTKADSGYISAMPTVSDKNGNTVAVVRNADGTYFFIMPEGGSVSDWAGIAMAWAVQNGIINGSDGKLKPQGNATRAQAAAMLARFCRNISR